MKTTTLALALASLLPVVAVAQAPRSPLAVTGRVLDAADGVAADGAAWRAWCTIEPAPIAVASPVGVARRDGFWADVAPAAGTPSDACQAGRWVMAAEAATAAGGVYFAVAPSPSGAGWGPRQFAAAQLVAIPVPSTTLSSGSVRLTWEAPSTPGGIIDLDDGLAAWSVLRSTDGSLFTEVGRVPASSTHELTDAPPAGTWQWALRPIFEGDVAAVHRGAETPPVTVGSGRLPTAPRPMDRHFRLRTRR